MGVVYHASSNATGIVSVDGTATAADTATVTIEDRSYTYTVQSGDTVTSIRDALVNLINQDPKVTATPSGEFERIILKARVQGPEGNGMSYAASAELVGHRDHDGDRHRIVLRRDRQLAGDAGESRDSRRVDLRVRHRTGRAGAERRQQGPDSDRRQVSRRADRSPRRRVS